MFILEFILSLPIPPLAIAVTATGIRTLMPYCIATQASLLIPTKLQAEAAGWQELDGLIQPYSGSLREAVAEAWNHYPGLVFALATGAVVRLIAPLLQNKGTDPAIVVVDEAGKFTISLCGGHQGGGDRLTQTVSTYLEAMPVITGAAHYRQLPGIDVLGHPFGWTQGDGDWTGVASAIAQGHPVQVIQEVGTKLWQGHLPTSHGFQFGWPEVPALQPEQPPEPQGRIWISAIQRRFSDATDIPKVQWHPRVLWVGIGCERNTPQALMEWALEEVLQSRHLAMGAIAGIATLNLKSDEAGLLALCHDHGWPLRCFEPAELSQIRVPNPSNTVAEAVGTPSVAEAAAILAAQTPYWLSSTHRGGTQSGSVMEEVLPLSVGSSGTLDTAELTQPFPDLCVSKKVMRHPDHDGAMTLAIAQAEQEYIGRTGHLALVGTGPGSLSQLTAAAKAAIGQADAVIGYELYIDLIRPLLRPGQLVEALPITQEQQRANRAISLARWGLSVAVISSGDCGIYAMAGLILETLQAQGWDGHHPTVESYPGISALQASAARVGAPLMHDFCAISLSDLLTPWSVIEKRLQAAASADFVVVLYNPKSQKRTEHIERAQRILLTERSPETPVAIVQSAYRPNEQIVLTTLAEMLSHTIDMLTTVIIGNRSTRLYAGKLITPRGYRV